MSVAELGLAVDSAPIKEAKTSLDQFAGSAKGAAQSAAEAENKMRHLEISAKRLGITTAELSARQAASANAWQKQAAANQNTIGAQAATSSAFSATSAAVSRLIPIYGYLSLAMQAVTAVSSAYYALNASNAPTLEKSLEEQARLIGLVKDAYRDAAKTAGTFYNQSKAIAELQISQNILALQEKIREQLGQVVQGSKGTTSIEYNQLGNALGTATTDLLPKFEPFRAAFEELSRTIHTGADAAARFRDTVAGIGNADPRVAGVAAEILGTSQAAGQATDSVNELIRAQKVMRGTATADDRAGLGLSNRTPQAADPFAGAEASVNRHIAAMKADALAVNATVGEHARLRTEAQLLEAAQRTGGQATAAQIKRMQELGRAASDAAMALEKARIHSEIKFGAQTTLLSPEDVQIAQQLKGLYPDVATALGSVEAQAMRVNSALRQMSDLGQEINRGMMVEFGQQIRAGASAFEALQTAGTNALGKIADKLASMAADNLWKSAFGGTSGNIFSSLFGGGAGATMSGTGLGAGTGGLSFPMFNANGNAFDQTNVIPFARGGIVDRPTLFQFANGGAMANGVMGEAGPEAIMPLTRGANGKLGVASHGGGAPQGVHVTVGVSVDETGNLQAYVKNVSQDASAKTLSAFVHSPGYVEHIGNAAKKARGHRKL